MVRSWRSAWSRVVPYFAFSAPVRKAIYTTHAIESLNGVIRRRVLKLRGPFTSPRLARKRIYLALREISDKWKAPPVVTGVRRDEHSRFTFWIGSRLRAVT